MEQQGLQVSRAEAGQKLLNFLQRRIDAPTGDFHRWIRTGQVRVNGARAKAFDRIEEGDLVRVPPFAVFLPAGNAGRADKSAPSGRTPSTPKRSEGRSGDKSGSDGRPDAARTDSPAPRQSSSLRIVHEDEDILVIAKPAGLPVQGGTGHSDSIAARLAQERADADFVPAPVHRLDKDTTGLLIAGKTYAAVRLLTDALAGRGGQAPRKEYLAWGEGHWPFSPEDGPQELHDVLAKDKKAQRMRTRDDDEGQEARCIVTTLETRRHPEGPKGREYSLLLVRLLTGRTHQIRVQLASRGHAIVGDPWYGNSERKISNRKPERDIRQEKPAEGLKLHAFRLTVPLPGKTEPLSLDLLPPWKGAWKVSKV